MQTLSPLKTEGRKSATEHSTRLGQGIIPLADPAENTFGEILPCPKARQETLTRAALTLAAALELNEVLNRLETSFGWAVTVEPTERPSAGLQALVRFDR
jgi:hypothetical protein